MYYTPDNLKEIKAEERAYEKWAKSEENRIMRMSSSERKQKEYGRVFGFKEFPSLSESNEVY